MLAKYLIEQYGGSDGELAAALRYLNQRYTIPEKVIGLLTDLGTEEFAHLEMIATMVYKLTKDATPEQLKQAGPGEHYANHGMSLFYHNAAGSDSCDSLSGSGEDAERTSGGAEGVLRFVPMAAR